MRSGVILKKVRSLKLPTIRPGKLLVVLMQVFFILSTYSGIIIPLAELNPVLAAPTSTDGYYDCIVSSPTYFNGEECYIRGTYLPHSGWNPDAGCFMTNRVYYPSSGQQYTFCDPLRTAALTNREVIGFVRWNGNGTFNILNVVELAETFNQPPNQPSMIRPQSGWEMGPRNNGAYTGVSCNTSGTGLGCSVDFATTSFDPDFYQWIRLESEITRNQGGNQNFNQQLNNNNETYTRNLTLNDGNWNYRARNCDTAGECSGFTGYRTFLVDTTAPTGVNMVAEPAFSPTTQNTVSSSAGSDNVVGGIEYEFQVDDDPAFASPNNSSGWITTNSFTFASLTDEQKYHYRVRSRDRLYNTSNWGTTTSSTQDSTLPVVSNVALNPQRISPQNVDGQFDSAILSLEWTEKYPQASRLEVLDSTNNIIRSIVTPLPTGSTNPTQLQFNWDGRDNGGNLVVDGPYVLRIVVRDLAGNEASDDSSIVIVDNLAADISVSTPATGSWFRQSAITINGQTEGNAQAWITNNQNSTQSQLTIDGLGLFAHSDSLGLGANSFLLNAQDSVLNSSDITVNYYREEAAPTINTITPDGLINNRRPEISLNLSDSGYNNGTNDYISGVDPNSVFISLTHPSSGELVLVNGGVNTQPALGSIVETCSAAGAFGNSTAPSCTYKFVFSADLTPDGDYLITARVNDKAGNSAVERTQAFQLDSNIHSEVNSPANGNLFNYSKITITGTSEINSEVSISLPLGDVDGDSNVDTQSFIVSPSAVNDARVVITNCRASSSPLSDGVVEICDWTVTNFQLERDIINAGNVANQIKVDTKDNIDSLPLTGLNQKSQLIDVNVDLYAVTLAINTDIEFFSPNGDGRQDGVNFLDISASGQVESYTLEIKDSNGVVVKSFSAGGNPPASIPWDGRDSGGNFVADGTYTYQFKIITTDGINFETTPVAIQAATTLTNTVVITNPKTNSFSSRGVITVQGQAPQALSNSQTSELKVKICVDTISIAGSCDSEYYTTVDPQGFFSTIVMLPRVGLQDEHYLTASALDKYGNQTPPSNQVKVTTTASPPFESVQIIPVLTGTNSPEAYQLILDKLDNGQEITAADINSLRSVVMRSNVFQGTERVRLFFADHSKLAELPGNTNWNSIGYITGDNQTNLYKNFGDGITPYTACATTTCSWDFLFPLPSNLAGLYEVRFEGKLDQEVQNLTAGFTVDGNIPTTPIILDINKNIGGRFVNTNYRGNSFFSNSELIQMRGASDPSALIEVKDNSGNLICSTTASSVGIWSCEVDVSSLAGYSNPNSNVYTIPLTTYATIGLNTAQSIDNKTVVIDKIAPQIISVNTSSQWRKSGDVVNQVVVANESLSLALSIDKQNPADIDQCLNSSSSFDLNGMQIPVQMAVVNDLIVSSDNLANASGSFIVSGNAVEGRYCTTIGIADLAGNTAEQTQIFFIDNTAPNTPTIDVSDWGKFNGINTKPGAIAKGRLVPEFVHEENQVRIKAWSEENTSLLFYVNGALVGTNASAQAQCRQSLELDKIADGVNVQDKDICLYEFTYPLSRNGKDYAFQVKSLDRAGNLSIISEDEVVYYDNQNPRNPEVLRTASPSYNPTPGWMLGLNNSLTKDTSVDVTARAESLSDLEFNTTGPQNFKNYIFSQTPGNQVATQTLQLGNDSDEREGCVQMINTRRTGVCQDGNYEVSIKSTDAAGNPSAVTKHTVDRDTVRPAAASISASKSGDILGEYLKVSITGEKNATAVIQINTSTGRSYRINGQIDGNGNYANNDLIGRLICGGVRYTISVSLVDKAGNVGFISNISGISTTDCPVCGESSGLFEKPIHNNRAYIAHPYGYSNNYFGGKKFHYGVDYNGVSRGEPIYSTALGRVIETVSNVTCENCPNLGYGNNVKVDHGSGIVSVYAHLQTVTVRVGDIVGTNTKLGTMGSTGFSDGPHLHFAVERYGRLQDPKNYLGKETSNLDSSQFAEFCKKGGSGAGDGDDGIYENVDYNKARASIEEKLKEYSGWFGSYRIQKESKLCGSYMYDLIWDPWIGGDDYKGEIIYNPSMDRSYLLEDGRIRDKYYSIDNYCKKIGLPKNDQSEATKSTNSRVNDAYWQGFNRGDIYDYDKDRSCFIGCWGYKWQTYAIWSSKINEGYSSSGQRGFPIEDTRNKNTQCGFNGSTQKFENKDTFFNQTTSEFLESNENEYKNACIIGNKNSKQIYDSAKRYKDVYDSGSLKISWDFRTCEREPGTLVCADLVSDIYQGGGYDLEAEMKAWLIRRGGGFIPQCVARNVIGLHRYFAEEGRFYSEDGGLYQVGDVVLLDYGGGFAHSGVIVEVEEDGRPASVIQASYGSNRVKYKQSFNDFISGTTRVGHGRP